MSIAWWRKSLGKATSQPSARRAGTVSAMKPGQVASLASPSASAGMLPKLVCTAPGGMRVKPAAARRCAAARSASSSRVRRALRPSGRGWKRRASPASTVTVP